MSPRVRAGDPPPPDVDERARPRRRAVAVRRGGPRAGAGRPAEAGVAREESLRVLVTPLEKAELIRIAGGPGKLSALLRRAPLDLERWRSVADRLAEAIASGDDEASALEAYCALAETQAG